MEPPRRFQLVLEDTRDPPRIVQPPLAKETGWVPAPDSSFMSRSLPGQYSAAEEAMGEARSRESFMDLAATFVLHMHVAHSYQRA